MTEPDISNPAWLPHRLDASGSTVRYVLAPRPLRARIPFLTDEHLGDPPARPVPLTAAPQGEAPLAFIFHSAFCCSTLLANALEGEGRATTLKEPVLLNDIVGWRARGADAAALRQALHLALGALARPFRIGEAVIVKPSNLVNSLLPLVAALRPEAPLLLLHAPLPVFLKSIASKGLWGRLWVRELAWKLRRDRMLDFGLDDEAFFRLSDLQAAAIGWLAQHRLFHEATLRLGDRVRTLDSEAFLAAPAATLAALFAHFRLAGDLGEARAIAEGPVFAQDAKTGANFSPAARTAVHAGPAEANADEIMKVEAWATAVAAQGNLPLPLGQPLLPQ